LIKDYESRLKYIILENGDIKQTITNIAIKLSLLCKNFKISDNEIDENIKNKNYEFINNLPFDSLSSKLDEYFKSKFGLIEELLKKNVDFNNETNLNTTFTIDDEDDDDYCNDSINESVDNRKGSVNLSRNNSVNYKKKPGEESFTSSSEFECLKNELVEYKYIIKTQNEMINSFNQSLTLNSDRSIIEIEANSIIEERTHLAEEKKLYYKQKLQFEEEKLRYNQAILQLSRQVQIIVSFLVFLMVFFFKAKLF
jgi:hypothetical protein